MTARSDVAVLARNLDKVRSRQARLAYDSALGTSSPLPPLRLEPAPAEKRATAKPREVDSLRSALAKAQEEARRAALLSDSLAALDRELARLKSVAQATPAKSADPAPAAAVVAAQPPVRLAEAKPRPARAAEPPAPAAVPDLAASSAPVAPAVAGSQPAASAPVDRQDPLSALEAWAKAWSSQDVDAYLACYSPSFHPEGTSRQEWEDKRRERLRAPKSIQVGVVSPKLVVSTPDHAEILYRQNYQTETGKLTSRKRIGMDRVDGKWLIVLETEAR